MPAPPVSRPSDEGVRLVPRLKTCTACGRPFAPVRARATRCNTCTPQGRNDRSPTTRAQDAEYTTERARILKPGPDGRPPACMLRIKCQGAPATTVDHVLPVAKGGGHRGNLRPACGPCNSARQDKTG
jgi:5-methylcytosine-specific restriction endonuclease McrA